MEEERRSFKEAIKDWMSVDSRVERGKFIKSISAYIIIFVILLLILFVVPIISGGIQADDFDYYLPKSLAGWIVFWAIRIGTVIGNIAVFILFKQQAKINSQNNAQYLEAKRLLEANVGAKGFIPRSPSQMNRSEYLIKGTTLVMFTAAESIIIGTLVLNFDFITFLSCLTSSVTAVLFGFWTMIKNEVYWTDEYLSYAKYTTSIKQEPKKEENVCFNSETKNSETCKSK